MSSAGHANLEIWRAWARGITGAHNETDSELRAAIAELVKAPTAPWRERVARLGNTYLEDFDDLPDANLWRLVLEYTTKEPTAIARALLADRLGVDQRGRSLGELLGLVEPAKEGR